MTIAELIKLPDSPLSQEQRNELQEEYNKLLFDIKEKGDKLLNANAKSFNAEKKAKEEEELKRKAIDKAVGCLRAVREMLSESTGTGCTHRQRNFYSDAMIKFINNSVAALEGEKEPYPF